MYKRQVNDVLGLEASVKVREDSVSLRLPGGLSQDVYKRQAFYDCDPASL